jgi:hypothetical protein
MFSIVLIILLVFSIHRTTRPHSDEVDVVINGLIKSKPNASTNEDRGTKVLLFYADGASQVTNEKIIECGYADERGEFRTKVDRSKVGEIITCRIAGAGYDDAGGSDNLVLIMPFGAFYTAKMIRDRNYNGRLEAADVGNLKDYTAESFRRAGKYRTEAFEKLRRTGAELGDIPFLFWFIFYFAGIIAFAVDYLIFGSHFKPSISISNVEDALYLSAVTVTTLGFGDIVPKSLLAKFLTSLQALSGVVLVGLFLNSLFSSRS